MLKNTEKNQMAKPPTMVDPLGVESTPASNPFLSPAEGTCGQSWALGKLFLSSLVLMDTPLVGQGPRDGLGCLGFQIALFSEQLCDTDVTLT